MWRWVAARRKRERRAGAAKARSARKSRRQRRTTEMGAPRGTMVSFVTKAADSREPALAGSGRTRLVAQIVSVEEVAVVVGQVVVVPEALRHHDVGGLVGHRPGREVDLVEAPREPQEGNGQADGMGGAESHRDSGVAGRSRGNDTR